MDLAVRRVKVRVKEGGHNIPKEVVKRRYQRGINNFFELYKDVVDSWIVVNNSGRKYGIIAESDQLHQQIYDVKIWDKMKSYQNEQ